MTSNRGLLARHVRSVARTVASSIATQKSAGYDHSVTELPHRSLRFPFPQRPAASSRGHMGRSGLGPRLAVANRHEPAFCDS